MKNLGINAKQAYVLLSKYAHDLCEVIEFCNLDESDLCHSEQSEESQYDLRKNVIASESDAIQPIEKLRCEAARQLSDSSHSERSAHFEYPALYGS